MILGLGGEANDLGGGGLVGHDDLSFQGHEKTRGAEWGVSPLNPRPRYLLVRGCVPNGGVSTGIALNGIG